MPVADEPRRSLKELDAFKAEHKPKNAKVVRYKAPAEIKRSRSFVPLVRSDIMIAMVQIISKGGEQELHSHGAFDGFWFVLRGRAKFYGEGDIIIADIGEHEGIFIPRDFLYWFESSGDQPLEILQLEAIDKTAKATYHAPHRNEPGKVDVFSPEGEILAAGVVAE